MRIEVLKPACSTPLLNATVNLFTGAVSFKDEKGNSLLSEEKVNGRDISPVIWEGEPMYRSRQVFNIDTSVDNRKAGR